MPVIKFPKQAEELDLETLRLRSEHLAAAATTTIGRKPAPKRKRDFIHEEMARLSLGLDATGKVWAFVLQQQRMQPGNRSISVSSVRLGRLGVDRFAKSRALRALELMRLIRLERGRGHSPRVTVLV